MIGHVDDAGRALVTLHLRSSEHSVSSPITIWIDTAFDGELVLPTALISDLGLMQSAAVQATLADGSTTVLESFHCVVDWFGTPRRIEAIANDGRFPLLGVGLLRGRRLVIDFVAGTVELT